MHSSMLIDSLSEEIYTEQSPGFVTQGAAKVKEFAN